VAVSSLVARACGYGIRLAALLGVSLGVATVAIAGGMQMLAGFLPAFQQFLLALRAGLLVAVPATGVLALVWGAYTGWMTRALLALYPGYAALAPVRRRSLERAPLRWWQRLFVSLRDGPGSAHYRTGHLLRGSLWAGGWDALPALLTIGASGFVLAHVRAGATITVESTISTAAAALVAGVIVHIAYTLMAAIDSALLITRAVTPAQPVRTIKIEPLERQPAAQRAALVSASDGPDPEMPSTPQPGGPAIA
jgi:hypothetical protein